jgi:hypothetical protein
MLEIGVNSQDFLLSKGGISIPLGTKIESVTLAIVSKGL